MKIEEWIRYNKNSYNEGSATNLWRRKRMEKFERYIAEKILQDDPNKEIDILDVGGVWRYWISTNFKYLDRSHIVLLNIRQQEIPECWKGIMESVVGDATDMCQYKDGQFDVCFSNSVIEHVGGFKDQSKMASEVMRVGKIGYLQTPNRYFPIEPHFLFPFFQFLPTELAVFLLIEFKLGERGKTMSRKDAYTIVDSIRLLNKRELECLFPNAIIMKEQIFGLTKSFCLFF